MEAAELLSRAQSAEGVGDIAELATIYSQLAQLDSSYAKRAQELALQAEAGCY